MKIRVTGRTAPSPLRSGMWLLPFLLAVFLTAPGCALLNSQPEEEKIESEILVQSAEYGVVTQVTAARMKDKEIRLGDLAITVDTDNGGVLVVIQPEDDVYKVGDRVRVIRGANGFVRVQLL